MSNMSTKHTPGPWFIWQELAMQREECDAEEINDELTEWCDSLEVYAGEPTVCTRGSLRGHKAHICDIEVDALDFDDDEEASKEMALANARLIAAAPDLLEALQEVVKLANQTHDHWDNDRDAKVGKILLALSGHMPRYDKRIDAIHAAIAKATGATK